MIAWIKAAGIGAVAGLALGFGGGWAVNGWRFGEKLAKIEARAGEAEREARATEQRWADHTIQTVEAANAEADKLRAALARADAAHRSLHDRSASRAAEAASAPGTSPAAAAVIRLYAELFREADEYAGEVAAEAGRYRGAGLACERFDEVTR